MHSGIKMTRRELLALSAMAAQQGKAAQAVPKLCLFSKHLPKLDYNDLGKTVKQMGFDGVDLTVRPGGHVLPTRVAEDLPIAVERIRSYALEVPMITTALVSASDPAARPTLSTAGALKIPYYKLGYWRYRTANPESVMAEVKRDLGPLVALGKEYGVEAGFHNHSGDNVGTAIWDTREIIGDMDARWIGYYFDPCHATAEGGLFGWRLSERIALPRIKMVAFKDFYWEKQGGSWKMQMCPMGQGMVDWAAVMALLVLGKFSGPISLHLEYDTPDEHAAIHRDFEFTKKMIVAAYGARA
jgi:L-ribulose-5-phosphate 3-epimerase